jgi:hypothetical protein
MEIYVMHPETKKVIIIETEQCPDWKQKFLHRSWAPFVTDEAVAVEKLKNLSDKDLEAIVSQEEEAVEEVVAVEKLKNLSDKDLEAIVTQEEEVVEEAVAEWPSIEELRSEYTQVTGKQISIRYKNDREWLLQKIYEAKQ